MWVEITAARQNIACGPILLDDAASVEILSFDVYGVPLVGTEPYDTDFVVAVEEMNGPVRISSNSGPRRGVSLPLSGAVTRMEFNNPLLLGKHTGAGRTDFTFRVTDTTGRDAVFTRMVLRMRICGNLSGLTDPMDTSDRSRALKAQSLNRVRNYY